MSRASVRSALLLWLDGTTPGINTWFPVEPKVIDPASFKAPDGSPSGAIGIIHLERSVNTRQAVGGMDYGRQGGMRQRTIDIALEVKFRSSERDTVDAMSAWDATAEALEARMMATLDLDTAGGPNPIFAVAQTGQGLQWDEAWPVLDGQVTVIWAALRFPVVEMLTA